MKESPLSRNIPLFIAFRVFFNARWYYPVLAVLFLDFGLSVEQYALLNVAWAAAIVGLEVPSGALADQFGRKRMVVVRGELNGRRNGGICLCSPRSFDAPLHPLSFKSAAQWSGRSQRKRG